MSKLVPSCLVALMLSVGTTANASTVTINDLSSGYQPSYFVGAVSSGPQTHVIGVYETRSDHNYYYSPEGTAYVHVSGFSSVPIHLVLSSYEPTNWVLDGTGLSFIDSIIINGYNKGRVTGFDLEKVIDKTGSGNYISSCAYEWPNSTGGCNTPGLISGVEKHVGAPISSFSGDYRATDFSIVLTPVPEPQTYALMALGLAVVLNARRRTGKHSHALA